MTMLMDAASPAAASRPRPGLVARLVAAARRIAAFRPRTRPGTRPAGSLRDLSDRDLADLNLGSRQTELPDPRAPNLF